MPLPRNVAHVVGDDEPDGAVAILAGQHLEADLSLSDSSSSDEGADWSMNVTCIAATPGRVPVIARGVFSPEGRLPNPALAICGGPKSKTKVTNNGIGTPARTLRASTRIRAHAQPNSVRNLRSTSGRGRLTLPPPRLATLGAVPSAIKFDIMNYFYELSAKLVHKRIRQESFERLRDGVDLLLLEIFNSSMLPVWYTVKTSDTTLAKPFSITCYFHELTAKLLRKRIFQYKYVCLRDNVDSLLVEIFNDRSLLPKNGR